MLSPGIGTKITRVTPTPPRQRLATLLLGRPVLDFIAEHRANGASYRAVAAHLRDATSGEIDVSDVTVRAWVLAAADTTDLCSTA